MATELWALTFFTHDGLVVRCFGHKTHLKSAITAWEEWSENDDEAEVLKVIRVSGISPRDRSDTLTAVQAVVIRVMNLGKIHPDTKPETETKMESKQP